jgi:general secretion pathway protein G
MTLRQAQAHTIARSAFTLMEVLVVVAILVVLAGVGGVMYMRYLDEARENTAKIGIQELEKAVELYKLSYGDYPGDLVTLTQPLDGKPAPLEARALLDPWQRAYVYEGGNRHPATGKPRIYSMGPNAGDASKIIANW